MPRPLFEYGLNEWDQEGGCPGGHTCDGRMEPDADALWRADAGEDIRDKYDVVLRIYAGYDETTVWQEFGEMRFASRDDIPAEWGNPDPAMPRWVTTRYVPWTSWLAGAQQWGLSSVRQGESSGTITHELGHLVFRVGDNNNNPYVTPYRRVGTGPWDMMDRGSFNGPGGPHRRWVVPAAEGASMPAGLMLRNRLAMEILPADQVLRLSREALAASGPAVVRVNARAVEPGGSLWNEWAGVIVRLDGEEPRDRTPPCDRDADPLCAGDPVFDDYSIEVVQRIGYDSFTPDNGVLIAKNKDRQTNSCGYGCHAWVIDAHPEDIDMVDFVRPGSGERVMRTIADYRQLNDALFHAGLRSGSEYEFVDEPNRVHVYVIDRHVDLTGVLSYSVGVRSLEAAGPQARGGGGRGPAVGRGPGRPRRGAGPAADVSGDGVERRRPAGRARRRPSGCARGGVRERHLPGVRVGRGRRLGGGRPERARRRRCETLRPGAGLPATHVSRGRPGARDGDRRVGKRSNRARDVGDENRRRLARPPGTAWPCGHAVSWPHPPAPGGGVFELKMSATTFQAPAASLRQTVTYFSCDVIGVPSGPSIVICAVPHE
jgi:M6 family metalloprotease-like protein